MENDDEYEIMEVSSLDFSESKEKKHTTKDEVINAELRWSGHGLLSRDKVDVQ